MDKKHISLAILIVCVISLVLGFISPKKQEVENIQTENPFASVKDVVGEKIALLNIEGVISSDLQSNSWTNAFTTDAFLSSVDKVQKDDKVKAVIVRINSPGGTVAASQDIYDALMRLRKTKPVIVSMADVAASGGYYTASAADRIVAQKGTMTGSIGVIFNFVDVAGLTDKLGITSNVVKSGKFKDAGSMYRKMSSEEKELFQKSVTGAYSQFIAAITDARVNRTDNYAAEKRNLTVEILKKYADGRVFLGDEAYELGFVDKLGSLYDAQILASEMAGSKNILPIVPYNRMNGLKSLLLGIEGRLSNTFENVLPFSVTHNSRPLMIWE